MRKILPTITSIGLLGSTWRDKIKELTELELQEIALFVTGLSKSERDECFNELRIAHRKHKFTIPFCHTVSSMTEDEYKFLQNSFGTERFNLHAMKYYPLQHPLSDEIKSRIYIENSGDKGLLNHSDLEGFAGVCLDVSHLFDTKIMYPEIYPEMLKFLDGATIGVNHISAANPNPSKSSCGGIHCSKHVAEDTSQFDYLNNFPARYFSDYCAIELENPLKEQIVFKSKIESIITSQTQELPKAA